MSISQDLTLKMYATSVLSNTSNITIKWTSTQSGESWNENTGTAKYYVCINGGEETEYSVDYTLPQDATTTIVNKSIVVKHRDDGTATVTVRTWMDTGTDAGVIEKTKSYDLPIIKRETTIDSLSCSSEYFTGTLTVKYTPKYKNFDNRIILYLEYKNSGDTTWKNKQIKRYSLGQKATSQQTETISFTENELSTIYSTLSSLTSGRLRVQIGTYMTTTAADDTWIGQMSYKNISLSIPNDTTTQPTMTMTLAPVNDSSALGSMYAKGLSKVKATFSNGASPSGATSFTYTLTVAGKDYSSPYTSDYLSTTGSITVKGTITDSRGYSRSYSQTISVLDYTVPSLDSLSCSSSYFTGTITHKYTPPNNTFYTRCAITLGSTTVKSETHTRASGQQTVSFSFEESELATIYEALPNSTSGTLKFTFQAFTDSSYSKQIGSDSAREITLSIPNIDATKPTATMTLALVSSLESPFNSLYIKGKTKVAANISEGVGKYGATIKSYEVNIGAQSGTPPFTSDFLSASGDIAVMGTVTDSRGFSRTYTQTITVIDYSAPRLIPISGQSEVIAARCNSAGVLDSNGTYLKIAVKRSYSTVVSDNVQKNFCAIQYRYKIEGGLYSSWSEILSKTASSDEVTTGALLGGVLSTTSTYIVQIMAIDDIGDSIITTISLPTESVYLHKAGSINSIGIGKYAEIPNSVDIAKDKIALVRGTFILENENEKRFYITVDDDGNIKAEVVPETINLLLGG